MTCARIPPAGKAELARDRELRIGQLDGRGIGSTWSQGVREAPARCRIPGANGAEQVLRSLTLLFEIESEGGVRVGRGGVRVGRPGHADPLSCACVHHVLLQTAVERRSVRA